MEPGGMVFLGLVIFCFTLFGVTLGIASFEDSRRSKSAKAAGKTQAREKISAK